MFGKLKPDFKSHSRSEYSKVCRNRLVRCLPLHAIAPSAHGSAISRAPPALSFRDLPAGHIRGGIFFCIKRLPDWQHSNQDVYANRTFRLREVRSFPVRRWFRTLPNYWLILILNFAVFTALGLRSFCAHHLKYFPRPGALP